MRVCLICKDADKKFKGQRTQVCINCCDEMYKNNKWYCLDCNSAKSLENFEIRKDSGNYRFSCKECVKEYNYKYQHKFSAKICVICKEIDKKTQGTSNVCFSCFEDLKLKKQKHCGECNQVKVLDQFGVRKNGKPITQCKECRNKKGKKRFTEKKKEILAKEKIKYHQRKNDIIFKEKRKRERDKYYNKYKNDLRETKKLWAREHPKTDIQKEAHREWSRKYSKEKYNNDPIFKLRKNIGTSIRTFLKKQGKGKRRESTFKNLNYSVLELKNHLESLFEPWMTWDNWGVYNSETWNDNDPSTWTWQIDHIIPHSVLSYSSINDNNFKKCWALSNLRPLSAKQNQLDGATRIRHQNG